MIELVFLGTGSGIPTPSRNHAAIWMRHEGQYMLFDCGEGTQRQILKARLNFMRIDNIFITHWHADHWAGLIGLLLTMNLEERRRPLHVYGPEADRFVGDILDLGYWGTKFKVMPEPVPYDGDDITSLLRTRDFEVSSIPVEHSVPAVAYSLQEHDRVNVDIQKANRLYGLKQGPLVGKLKEHGKITLNGKVISLRDVCVTKKGSKIVYSGDTRKCDNMLKIAKKADILIHDTTFADEVEDMMHTGAKEAARIAKNAGVKKLILTHFSRRYTDLSEIEQEAKKIFSNSVIAKDFMKLSV
ncbi:MAG: ribonuclease Z [Candidatus Aenigmarchaeota archaeon]|nr:ribonuclease Z [Candidatus Aenigmarchaeota archaeon]